MDLPIARREPPLSIERHAGTVKDQAVVPTHMIDVNHRYVALHGNRFQHVMAQLHFFTVERRRSNIQHHVSAGVDGFFHRIAGVELLFPEILIVPGVLTDRHTQAVPGDLVNRR